MQLSSSEQFCEMKKMYAIELRESQAKIGKLEEQVKKLEKKYTNNDSKDTTRETVPSPVPQIKISVNNKTPPPSEKPTKAQMIAAITSISVSPMTTHKLAHRKSAEEETMDILGIDPLKTAIPVTNKPRRSFEGQRTTFVAPKLTSNRLTITEMVEENMHVPGTMAAIRRQLKSDGLTPRINRKLKEQQQLQQKLQQSRSLYKEPPPPPPPPATDTDTAPEHVQLLDTQI